MDITTTLDGQVVHLDGDQVPGVTLRESDVTDPGKLLGTSSTTIRILATKELLQVLGSEAMNERPAFSMPELRMTEGGDPIFAAPVLPLQQDRDRAEVVALGDNAAWMPAAKSTKLQDLDLGESGPITSDYQRGTWGSTTSPVAFPLADFGSLLGKSSSYDVPSGYPYPAVRVRHVLDHFFGLQGLRLHAEGRLATELDRYLVLAPKEKPGLSVPNPAPYAFNLGGGPNSLYFVPTTGGAGTVDLNDYKVNLADPFDPGFDGAVFRVVVYDFTAHQVLGSYTFPAMYFGAPDYGGLSVTTTIPVQFTAGHQVATAVEIMGLDGRDPSLDSSTATEVTYTVGAETLWVTALVSQTYQMTDGADTVEYTPGARIRYAKALPNWSVMDLVNELTGARGLTWSTDRSNRRVTVRYASDHYKVPGPSPVRDWRDRADHTRPPVKRTNILPQRYAVRFAEDEKDRHLDRLKASHPQGFGSYVEEVGGPGEAMELELNFAATAMGEVLGGLYVPILRTIGAGIVDTYELEPRLLYDNGEQPGSWVYDGTSESTYPAAYFVPRGKGVNLCLHDTSAFGEEVAGAWPRTHLRHFRRLKNSRLLEIDLFLWGSELKAFDFGKPTVADDGHGPGVYYVVEVKNFRPGLRLPTKVVLQEIDRPDYAVPYTYREPALVTGGDFNSDFSSDFRI